MLARMVVFHAPKQGHDEHEWEDGAAADPGDPAAGRDPRFAVADGATEGFGSARWAQHLVAGFVGLERAPSADADADADAVVDAESPPALRRDELHGWLARAQADWHADPRAAGATDLARLKMARVGSFATVLGGRLRGLAGPEPRWEAVALGDTVLFHVRDGRLLTQFPDIPADGFGVNPDGVSTHAERLPGAAGRLSAHGGPLALGDALYVATDAFAQWMVRAGQREPAALWPALAGWEHPASFRALVADRRRAGEMTNDDVTLLRVRLVAVPPTRLVVCL